MTTDTSEASLERLICIAMTGTSRDPASSIETGEPAAAGGPGWLPGSPGDYEREYAVDLAQLAAFLLSTQPEVPQALDLATDGPTRQKFLARLQGEVSKRGVIDILRKGVKHGPHDIDLFYGTP